MRVAVVGGGWAGLAAAVQAVQADHSVCLFEMARELGGRARRVDSAGHVLDNGQHILIGAYRSTLDLIRTLGVCESDVLLRLPMALRYADGSGLAFPQGAAVVAFARAVLGASGWSVSERSALLGAAAVWAARRFRCPPGWTVAQLARGLPARVRGDLIEPLCVAALNTPASAASAAVFLRVLRDALFGGRGGSDLLLPRRPLDALLPAPAAGWLEQAGAQLRCSTRVGEIRSAGAGWTVDGEDFDAVVLACSAVEAARLAAPIAPAWAARAAAFDYEPIVTVYLRSAGTRLPQPMTALRAGPAAPAQFIFDHGALGGTPGLFAAVVSGAREWLQAGLEATADAVRVQAEEAFASSTWREPPTVLRALAERRATFLCKPALDRPPSCIAPRLAAAGDYVEGPYPATLEGAVRSGLQAIAQLG